MLLELVAQKPTCIPFTLCTSKAVVVYSSCPIVVSMCRIYHNNSKLPRSIFTQQRFVETGSDLLKLIKFWELLVLN